MMIKLEGRTKVRPFSYEVAKKSSDLEYDFVDQGRVIQRQKKKAPEDAFFTQ